MTILSQRPRLRPHYVKTRHWNVKHRLRFKVVPQTCAIGPATGTSNFDEASPSRNPEMVMIPDEEMGRPLQAKDPALGKYRQSMLGFCNECLAHAPCTYILCVQDINTQYSHSTMLNGIAAVMANADCNSFCWIEFLWKLGTQFYINQNDAKR